MADLLNVKNPYEVELFKYISESFPCIIDEDREDVIAMVRDRAEAARDAYKWEIEHGRNKAAAREAAHNALYEGLTFSPYVYLKTMTEVEMNLSLKPEQLKRLYYRTKELFDSYGPDIEGDEREAELVEKLQQAVKDFIKDESD